MNSFLPFNEKIVIKNSKPENLVVPFRCALFFAGFQPHNGFSQKKGKSDRPAISRISPQYRGASLKRKYLKSFNKHSPQACYKTRAKQHRLPFTNIKSCVDDSTDQYKYVM